MERTQQDPRLTANRSKSVNSSIADAPSARSYVGHNSGTRNAPACSAFSSLQSDNGGHEVGAIGRA